jgi:hypothetical protein
MFAQALRDMGLQASKHDPCLFSGVVTRSPSSINDSTRASVHVGIYLDDFVYYSTDPHEQLHFQEELKKCVVIDIMGPVDWFLGTVFTWKQHDGGNLSVFLLQMAFTEFTGHRFAINKFKQVRNMSPYCSGIPIDSIAPPDKHDPDLKRRTECFQSIVGSINWLATCTIDLTLLLFSLVLPPTTTIPPMITINLHYMLSSIFPVRQNMVLAITLRLVQQFKHSLHRCHPAHPW